MVTEAKIRRYQKDVTDAALNPAALAIPATSTTGASASTDLGTTLTAADPKNPRLADIDVRLVIDAQTVTTLPNGQTIIVDLQHSDTDGSWVTLIDNWLTSTGADGIGALETAVQMRLPANTRRYIRFLITCNGSGTGRDSTYVTMSFRV